MNRRWRGCAIAGVAVVMTTGCYRYVPAPIEATPPGTGVELFVTRDGAQQAEEAGALRAGDPRVRGTFVGVEGDDLLVRVPVAQRQDGFTVNRIDQSLRFPIGEIVSFQRRELNGLSTGVAIGAATAVAAGVIVLILDPLRGSTADPEQEPDETVLTFRVLSIPFGR